MQTKNRPKYVTELVRKVNKTLQTLGKQGENSDLHIFITSYLLDKKMYHGWNFYKDKYVNGKTISVLAGSATDFDYIQMY
jgi:hypothetical protein